MVYSTEEKSEIEETITGHLLEGVTVRFESETVFLEDDSGVYKLEPKLQEDVVYLVNSNGEKLLVVDEEGVESYYDLVFQSVNTLIWTTEDVDSVRGLYDKFSQRIEMEFGKEDLLKKLDKFKEDN